MVNIAFIRAASVGDIFFTVPFKIDRTIRAKEV